MADNETKLTYPYLTPAEFERLVVLQGELAEVSKAISKTMQHGYLSYDPTNPEVVYENGGYHPNNRDTLELKLGHLMYAIRLLTDKSDLSNINILKSHKSKRQTFLKWMYHQ